MIIDSDIIIEFLKNNKQILSKLSKISENERLATTSINVFEILKGYHALDRKEQGIIDFLNTLTILDFNIKSSGIAAETFNQLKKSGIVIDSLDLFIASIAIANNEKLLTRNVQHFKRIPELKIEEM